MNIQVEIRWDPEVFLWSAASRDVPELVLEDPFLDSLTERVRRTVPVLLAESGREPCSDLQFHYDGPNCR